MKAEHINPFLGATVKVINTMAFTECQGGKPYAKQDNAAQGDVSGIIGITGDNEGSMSISFTEACICGIVSSMFGEEITGIDREVEDAVGEITNMICGDARRVLDEMGIHLAGAIPTVVSGKAHNITHMAKGPSIAIPFTTQHGTFTLEISLNK